MKHASGFARHASNSTLNQLPRSRTYPSESRSLKPNTPRPRMPVFVPKLGTQPTNPAAFPGNARLRVFPLVAKDAHCGAVKQLNQHNAEQEIRFQAEGRRPPSAPRARIPRPPASLGCGAAVQHPSAARVILTIDACPHPRPQRRDQSPCVGQCHTRRCRGALTSSGEGSGTGRAGHHNPDSRNCTREST
jgi:hypothetical protein